MLAKHLDVVGRGVVRAPSAGGTMAPVLAKHRDIVGCGVVRAPSAGGTMTPVLAKHLDVVGRGTISEKPVSLVDTAGAGRGERSS